MKKLIKIMIILFIMVNINNLKAECPSGYAEQIDTITIKNCQYEIKVCFLCGMYSLEAQMQLNSWVKLDPNCNQSLNDFEVEEAILNNIFSWPFCKRYICLVDPEITPCNPHAQEPLIIKEKLYSCIKFNYDNLNRKIFSKCGESYCYSEYLFCFDPVLGPQKIVLQRYRVGDEMECPEIYDPQDPLNSIEDHCYKDKFNPCNF